MRLMAAAGVIVSIEVLLTIAMDGSLRVVARRRVKTGSPDPVSLGSSIFGVAWFLWHLPTVPWIVPSQHIPTRVKWLLVYLGTPAVYIAFFALKERGIIAGPRR